MKKKIYVKPQIEIEEAEQVDIICTSPGYNQGPIIINDGNDIIFEEEEW